jgi:Na+-translocating ferredoxin:NAD+ oxidoreductase subunit B
MPMHLGPAIDSPFALALIDEANCIGCTLCIQVCPTDAIVGAAKLMHTILADRCTGCELCVPPCPVDCIAMLPAGRDWTLADADQARERYDTRIRRLSLNLPSRKPMPTATTGSRDERKSVVAAALARARSRRAAASR